MDADLISVATIGLDARSAGSEAVYTYLAAPGMKVGDAYFVPLGSRRAIGFVLELKEVTADQLGFEPKLLKAVGAPIRGLELPEKVVELVCEVSRQTLAPLSVCLGPAIPIGIKDRLVTSWSRVEGPVPDGLSPTQLETLRVLSNGPIHDTKANRLPDGAKRTLRSLEKKELVRSDTTLQPPSERRRLTGNVRLTAESKKVDEFLSGAGKRRPAQALTLMRLQGSELASFSIQEIKSLGGVTDQTVKALVDTGLLETVVEEEPPAKAPTLNPHQQAAVDELSTSILGKLANTFLLFGVTGSGKTEVYLRAAQTTLSQGRQVLYLVPEIALTAQVIAQLRSRFGQRVAILHSNMTPSERLESWIRVRNGAAPVILGARSALFAPVDNLGLIIMDEEHEQSYKQDSAPRYHSKNLATWLAKEHGATLVLGSATPSLETFYESSMGAIHRLNLPKRAAAATMPSVEIQDLGEGYRQHKPSLFTPRLQELLSETLTRDEQVILFLNRRAYAPFIICRDCQHRFNCPRCAVALAFHLRANRLRCHHCGHHEAAPKECPACKSERVGTFGVGVEKVEEAVNNEFPDARVARLDRDVARKKGALEETLAKFRSGETNVLVGTQLVAKGLDFPQVTLVGVIAADMSLNMPDFRASERTFQLLSQVSGRSGRGQTHGRVVIQTLEPNHPAIVCAQTHDYEKFFADLIVERRAAMYPPFCRLINIVFSGENRDRVTEESHSFRIRLTPLLPNVEILGPTDCAIERLQGQWRRHILLKAMPETDLTPFSQLDPLGSKHVRVTMDVDAYNLF